MKDTDVVSGRMETTPSPLAREGGGRGGKMFEMALKCPPAHSYM
jgi:hypothetical protein